MARDEDALTLDGPAEMNEVAGASGLPFLQANDESKQGTTGQSRSVPDLVPRGLEELEPMPSSANRQISTPPARSESISPKSSEKPRSMPPTPAPRRRLFGLLPGLPVNPGTANATSSRPLGTASMADRESMRSPDHLTTEAIAEARLKSRIEKQARELIGDRARTIEVRVQGKSAIVQARGVKLYQKRSVRKSLETIPALTGLHSTVEILD